MFLCSLRYFANVPLFPKTPGRPSLFSVMLSLRQFPCFEEKCGTISGPRELLDFFPPVPRNLASPAKRAYKQLKKFPLLYLEMSRWNHFLSAIQAGSQSKDTSWAVLTGVDFNDRRPA